MGVLRGNPKPMTAYEILDQMDLDEHDLARPISPLPLGEIL